MKHEFALYCPTIDCVGDQILLEDLLLIQRIKIILRLTVGQSFILFNHAVYVQATIKDLGKKTILCTLSEKHQTVAHLPEITFLLPILKKEALAEAVYSLAEMGATSIQLIITKKVQRHWIPAEMERLQKIVIAAAEQSKNFAFPTILEPIPLLQALDVYAMPTITKIFFDAKGGSLEKGIPLFNEHKNILLLIGPEGDLADVEKEAVLEKGFHLHRLTPTVLRAQQAAALGLGFVRTVAQ